MAFGGTVRPRRAERGVEAGASEEASDAVASRRERREEFRLLAICTIFMALYYSALVSGGYTRLLAPVDLGLSFNSMLDHLLRGRFDVDANIIGSEGFERNGSTYAYFGILPALLRLALLPFGKLLVIDLTRASCALAATLNGLFNVLCLVQLQRHSAAPRRGAIFGAFLLSIVFGAPRVAFLDASIYQEVVLWASAIAALFVYCILRGLIVGRRGFSDPLLGLMSVLCGLALLTKVSTAIALYGSLVLLLCALAFAEFRSRPDQASRAFARIALSPRYLRPLAILGGFAVVCGIVNYGRFGNPLTFQDVHDQLFLNHLYPDRVSVLDTYGNFNITRLPYGLMYYFFPIWTVVTSNGTFLFETFVRRTMHGIEPPPSSFFISDPLLIFLAGVLLFHFWRRRGEVRARFDPAQAGAGLAGLSLSGLLMLTAIYMTFRYRMEFYPFLQLSAFLGYHILSSGPSGRTPRPALSIGTSLASASGIVAAHVLLLLTLISPLGPISPSPEPNETKFSDKGWIDFYEGEAAYFFPNLMQHRK